MTNKAPPQILNRKPREAQSTQWYREKENVHQHVFAAANMLEPMARYRARLNAIHLALYENVDNYVPGFGAQHLSLTRPLHSHAYHSKLTYNVIKACIDAAASKLAKNKPKPEFDTNNGDYRLQRKADLLTQYIDGVFYDQKAYPLGQQVFRDALRWGTGVLAVINDGERIRYERTLIDDIWVDDYEGLNMQPKTMMQVRPVFRDTMLERFQDDSKATKAILDAPQAERIDYSIADQIRVIEAWYLPRKTSEGFKGGRHVVCIENLTLLDEEYNKNYFPFAFFRWSPRALNFYGQGLAEELSPIQLHIAKLLRQIERNLRFAGLRVFVESASEINPNHLGGGDGEVTTYTGSPPVVATWPAVAPELYQQLEAEYRKAFEISGLSQLTVSAQKPAGITAAKALEELSDEQTTRFMLVGQDYEEFFLEVARQTIDMSRDLYGEGSKVKLKPKGSGFAQSISWKDIDLDEDKYELHAFPVSAFASSPAARLQQVSDLSKLGILQPADLLRLLEIDPDVRGFVDRETASLQRVNFTLDRIKYEGEYHPPDDYLNVPEAIKLTEDEINRSIVQGVPEHRLQLMRNFINDCQELPSQKPPTPTQQPNAAPSPPGQPALPPQARPEPLPTSAMMPQSGPMQAA